MKLKEYCEFHNLQNSEDLRIHLRNNLMNGKTPVAIYSCIICDEMIDPSKGCPNNCKFQPPSDIIKTD